MIIKIQENVTTNNFFFYFLYKFLRSTFNISKLYNLGVESTFGGGVCELVSTVVVHVQGRCGTVYEAVVSIFLADWVAVLH